MRTHPVDKLLEQHCYKSAAGLLQLVLQTELRVHKHIQSVDRLIIYIPSQIHGSQSVSGYVV